MRVGIADLKTHLSKYIQTVRQGGAAVEVCVREQPVALLTGLDVPAQRDSHQQSELARRLERRGLRLWQSGKISGATLTPDKPGDRRTVKNTILAMRTEKDW